MFHFIGKSISYPSNVEQTNQQVVQKQELKKKEILNFKNVLKCFKMLKIYLLKEISNLNNQQLN